MTEWEKDCENPYKNMTDVVIEVKKAFGKIGASTNFIRND